MLILHNDHYYAYPSPAESIHKDQNLLQKLAQYVSPVKNSPAPVSVPDLAPLPASTTDPIQRKFEEMEREIRMLSLRVSEQGVEMRHLKSKQESLDHACAEHLVELSELRKANEELTKSIERSGILNVST